MTGENFETTTVEEVSTVEVCDSCGTDLSDVEPSACEQRVLRDIKFTVVDLNSTLYKICSRPRPENLVCGDFVQSFLEG